MKKGFLLALLFINSAAMAALPPTAESMRRIKAVMDSHDVYDKLGAVNWITSIKEIKDGYELSSEKCTLKVILEEEEPKDKMIGPLPLKVKVGEMSCK
jgi:hypothetical protein